MRFWMKRVSESKICSMLLNTAEQPWPELCDPELLVMKHAPKLHFVDYVTQSK